MLIGLAAKGGAAVASFAFSWLIARQYGAEGVGLFSIALTTAALGSTTALIGLEYVTVRSVATSYGAGNTGDARQAVVQAISQTAVTSILLAAVLFIVRDFFAASVLDEPGAAIFIGVMAFAIPLIAFTKIASAALRGSGRVLASQLIDGPVGTGGAAVGLGLLMFAGYAGNALTPPVLYCIFGAIAAGSGWVMLRRHMRAWHPPSGNRLRTLAVGFPILCAVFSNLFAEWFAVIMLTASAGANETGLFRIAFQIVAVVNLLNTTAESILGPPIAQAYAVGDVTRIGRIVRLTALGLVGIASPYLAMIFFAPHFVLSLFGPEFDAAANALLVLAAGQVVNLLGGPVGLVLIMTGNERWTLAYGVAAAVVCIALCLWLIPLYGLMGAAIAITSATIFRRVAAALLARHLVGVPLIGFGHAEKEKNG